MMNFFDILQLYLVPFAFAVPVVIILFIIALRKPEELGLGDIKKPQADAAVPAPAPAANFAPVRQAMPGSPALPAAQMVAPMAATHASILVVDDSAVARAKLKKLFEGHGYIVATANDGLEALETIGKQRFNVILTDLEMPNMDGFELIAAVQGSIDTEDIPIIAITGNEDFSVRVHAIGGLYGLFKKPWNDRDLLKRVDSLATMRHPVSSGV